MVEERRVNAAAGRREEDFYDKWNSRIRDMLLYLVGVGGCVYMIFFVSDPPPALLIFVGSLVGMPLVLGADEKRNGSKARRVLEAMRDVPEDDGDREGGRES